MKCLKSRFAVLCFITTLTLGYSTLALAGSCAAITTEIDNLNFGASLTNDALNIPADTPDGTVVYQETAQGIHHTWKCTMASMYGILLNPALGAVTGNASLFPLGKSGLSFRIWMNAIGGYQWNLHPIAANSPNSNYVLSAGEIRLEIVKTGPLAENTKIAAGHLANFQDDDLILKTFNLTNPIVLNTASCQTPSVPVAMGDDYQLQDFDNVGATPRKVRFNIGLNQCQAGIKKVTYSLKATTSVIDAAKGIVALNSSSTAAGIGLQLLNDTGQPIALDTTYPFDAFTTTGTKFQIPLSAAYYRLPTGNLKAGSANTDVTFIVNYL
ncbi:MULTISPECIES: fimbrial protein [Pseudomonas]|jgi:type 1 fimbria pilin|uniref:S-fimbrial protein subunit SfaA n=1 Tax=Pseudomonas fluorescens TaxID=294 RepID=A0A120G568_PSEFL|nr:MULTISPECIES: fimbrial protein [Pseudomonas]KAA6197238.1 fimbrial protein [Pseudomonas lactis]KRC96178.1 oxidoreductase [Pseudomonas sp. Root9]KWV83638.1 S-fimbrial protein subunit SfaA precursor [Pseudomonas fluorescens]